MEIEFSPSRLPAPRESTQVKGGPAPSATNEPPPLQGMAELQQKLNDLALSRPDKVDSLRPVISGVKYPPEELLNGIAHLLAIHINQ
jgi:hypothetical protein